jgi:4a-hydroxytetrahydrobiopterin dehydratase
MSGWSVEHGQITRRYKASSFHRAVGFVVQIAILADKADHHPDIDIRYDTVTIALSTHSEGGITQKDIALARAIDATYL